MNAYKRFIFIASLLSLVFLGIVAAWLWLYDPLQFYHKPYFRDLSFSNDMRVQNKGIIKNYDFDSFILGTSMLQNTSAKEANAELGGKFVNISMGSSVFSERAVILRYLFAQKPDTKRIIYSLDLEYLPFITTTKDTSHFDFLYDDNELNDIRMYFNQKFIFCALAYSKKSDCVGEKELESLTFWTFRPPSIMKALGGFQNWLGSDSPIIALAFKELKEAENPYTLKPFEGDITQIQSYVRKYIFDIAKAQPQTKFEIIIPPYARFWYRVKPSENFAKIQVALRWFVKESTKYENIKVYGFDDLPYSDEIANYVDYTHYNVDMNSLFIKAIKTNSHLVNSENIDTYLAKMQEKIEKYDILPFLNILKAWENNKTK